MRLLVQVTKLLLLLLIPLLLLVMAGREQLPLLLQLRLLLPRLIAPVLQLSLHFFQFLLLASNLLLYWLNHHPRCRC